MGPPKKQYIPILLLALLSLLLFSHYTLTPPPSLSAGPTTTAAATILSPLPQNFTFTIKVLAFNRLPSLSRCLGSLSSALYGPDTVHLHLFLDHDPGPDLDPAREILDFVDGFRWDFGEKVVHYRTLNVGLQAQWLEAWWPNSDHDFVFVVEDDLEVSPLYYQFIKRLIVEYYYNQSNFRASIFGASLQRPRFVPGKHGNKLKLDSDTRLFLYQLVGTWGQLLFPKPWKEFRLWYDDHKTKGIKPVLEGMVTTGWYKRMGERIWTPWFIKFIHSRGYFNFYTNFNHERALSVSHRDTGVNYGKTAGPDSQLLDKNSLDINLLDLPPLSNLKWFDFCFRQVLPERVAKFFDEISHILQSMDKQKPILLVNLSKASEAVIKNLICHFEKLNIQNYIFMVSGSDSGLILDLGRRGHPVIDTEDVFNGLVKRQKSSPRMIKGMVVKAYLVNKCLESGFDSWSIDWNMLPVSDNLLLDSTDSTYDFYYGKSSGIFIARSSSSSRKIWDEKFVLNFAVVLESIVKQDTLLGDNGNFVDVVTQFAKKLSLRLKGIDESNFSLKLEGTSVNQTLPANIKLISWSPHAETNSVQKRLQDAGMWIIDGDYSCKAVICHQS